jgi:hypothetical protein
MAERSIVELYTAGRPDATAIAEVRLILLR